MRIRQRKYSRLRAPQAAQMRSAAQILTQLMRYRAHVSACADAHFEAGFGPLQRNNLKAGNTDRRRLQFHRLAFARQFVSRGSRNFFAEKGGGICSISPLKRPAAARTWSSVNAGSSRHPTTLALGVIGVGRESEADRSGIALLSGREILRQPRKFAQSEAAEPR